MDAMDECLAINEFFFFINRNGEYMKTKNQKDFDVVLVWGEVLFSGKIKNGGWLHFRVGQTWSKKRIVELSTSKNSDDNVWYDVCDLDVPGVRISEIKFGGTKIPESCESL